MKRPVSFVEQLTNRKTLEDSVVFNNPYVFKGIKFRPIKLSQIVEFQICSDVLMIKQEQLRDKTLMKLPYMWMLMYAYENAEKYAVPQFSLYVPLLFALIEMTAQTVDIDCKIVKKEDGKYKNCTLLINEVEINNQEFMEIRRIIFEQNGIEFDDMFIHEDALMAIKLDKEMRNKKSGFIEPSLDDYINKFCMYMRMSKEEVCQKFTVRDFYKFLTEISMFEEYKIMKSGEMSGMVKFSKPIPHWFSKNVKKGLLDGQNVDYKNSSFMNIN